MRTVAVVILAITVVPTVFTQPAPDPARAAGIRAMRVINTAENAIRQSSGKYVELADLLTHPHMVGIRGDIVTNGSVISYQGQQLRLALARDASQYQAMVVPVDTCGTAVFSDERGVIYTGKGLGC